MSENGENLVKTAGADLRAMLMVGNNNSNGGGGKTRGGNRGRAKKAQSRISYDKDALMAIGKNAASQKRPEFLDPEYDSKPSQQEPGLSIWRFLKKLVFVITSKISRILMENI